MEKKKLQHSYVSILALYENHLFLSLSIKPGLDLNKVIRKANAFFRGKKKVLQSSYKFTGYPCNEKILDIAFLHTPSFVINFILLTIMEKSYNSLLYKPSVREILDMYLAKTQALILKSLMQLILTKKVDVLFFNCIFIYNISCSYRSKFIINIQLSFSYIAVIKYVYLKDKPIKHFINNLFIKYNDTIRYTVKQYNEELSYIEVPIQIEQKGYILFIKVNIEYIYYNNLYIIINLFNHIRNKIFRYKNDIKLYDILLLYSVNTHPWITRHFPLDKTNDIAWKKALLNYRYFVLDDYNYPEDKITQRKLMFKLYLKSNRPYDMVISKFPTFIIGNL